MFGLMPWVLTVAAVGVLLWAAWPRPAKGARGHGTDIALSKAPPPAPSILRVATFNIYGAKGRDGRRDVNRIIRDLGGLDLVALQEVHDSWRARGQLEALAEASGLGALKSPTRERWFRHHRNNALLTRYPVADWLRTPLVHNPGQRFQFRNLTSARIDTSPPLQVIVTHLSRRDREAAQLAEVMNEFLRHSPAVLMGDFNMTRQHPSLSEYLARVDVIDALGETLDVDDPTRIDWILCRGVNVKRGGVVDSGASDHPLYWCEIEL